MFFTTHDDWMKQNSSHCRNPLNAFLLYLSSINTAESSFLNLFKLIKGQNNFWNQQLKTCIFQIIHGYKDYNLCFKYFLGCSSSSSYYSSELKSKASTMATSVHVIDCSHWNLQWKCTPSEGQTTQWIMTGWECKVSST